MGAGPCAVEGVKRAHDEVTRIAEEEAEEKLTQAKRLLRAGFEEKARELVKDVAESSTIAIPAGLRSVNQRLGWWRELLGEFGPPLRLALEILIILAAAAVVVMLVITGVRALLERFRPAAQLTGFAGSSEASLSDSLSAMLGDALIRMRDDGRSGTRVTWQSGTEPKFEVPSAITQAVPQAGLLTGFIEMLGRLLPRRLYLVSGTMHPAHEHRGAGITLALAKRNGHTVDEVTLWEKDFALKEAGDAAPLPVRYERLILPAAVWLGYRSQLQRKRPGRGQKEPQPLQTADWRSYALFALGEIAPDETAERALYEQALDRDPGNLGAHFNLAVHLLRRPPYEVPPNEGGDDVANGSREGWSERLHAADEHLRAVAHRAKPETDPIWYRARYMQAVVCLYREDGAGAQTQLNDLNERIRSHIGDPQLSALLNALLQPILVLESSAAITGGDRSGVNIPPALGDGWHSATAEYNLACFWSRYAKAAEKEGKATKEDDIKERTREAVRALRQAIGREEGVVKEATVDPAFDPIREDDGFLAVVAEPPKKPKPTIASP